MISYSLYLDEAGLAAVSKQVLPIVSVVSPWPSRPTLVTTRPKCAHCFRWLKLRRIPCQIWPIQTQHSWKNSSRQGGSLTLTNVPGKKTKPNTLMVFTEALSSMVVFARPEEPMWKAYHIFNESLYVNAPKVTLVRVGRDTHQANLILHSLFKRSRSFMSTQQ